MLYCQDHIIGLRLSLSAEDIAEGSRPGDRSSLFPLESLQQVTVWARNIYCQVIDISFVRRVSHILLAWALLVPSAMAIRELVELEELQPAQQAERIILDPSDTPIPNMKGTRLQGWTAVLRSTTSDDKGYFRLSRQRGKNSTIVSVTLCLIHYNSRLRSIRALHNGHY